MAIGNQMDCSTGLATQVEFTPLPIAVTPELIVAERERRLELGFDYDFGDARGVHHIGTTESDMKGWGEVTQGAGAAVALGMGSAPIGIVTDTGPVTITALEWQAILLAASAARQPLWTASFVLQATLPDDYADDGHWA